MVTRLIAAAAARWRIAQSASVAIAVAIASLVSGCSGYPRFVKLPYDVTGRSLNSPSGEFDPNISRRYLVFTSDRGRSQDVYLYDLQSKRLIDLPGLNSLDTVASHPSVSQSGRYLAFAATRQGRTNIFLYDRTTRQLRNLTDDLKADVRNPSISADGRRIAFEASEKGQWDIFVRDRNGKPLDFP